MPSRSLTSSQLSAVDLSTQPLRVGASRQLALSSFTNFHKRSLSDELSLAAVKTLAKLTFAQASFTFQLSELSCESPLTETYRRPRPSCRSLCCRDWRCMSRISAARVTFPCVCSRQRVM